MHDAKMDQPDFRAVVIDHRNCIFLPFLDGDFFPQFAAHSILVAAVAGKESVILLGNVPADSNRKQTVQPALSSAAASAIPQYLISADDKHVRNELFVTIVVFSLA